MENDFIKRLEERAAFKDPWDDWELAQESLDHIRKLEAEIGVLFAANVRLNSRADLDSDGYVDHIEKLEAALRGVIAVADRDTPEFRFAREVLSSGPGETPAS